VTNVAEDKEGTVAVGRMFAGNVKEGDRLFLVNGKAETVASQVFTCMGSFRESVGQISAGNLVAILLRDSVKAGETLVDPAHGEGMVPFESIKYVSEPVVTVAVEPDNPKDLPALLEAMDKLAVEDPNLMVSVNRETGEYLLSGMGELHLEIAINQLKSIGSEVKLAASSPRVVYRESITKKGVDASTKSPNKRNKFTVQVEPMEEELAVLVDQDKDVEKAVNILAADEYRNILVDATEKKEQSPEVLEFIVGGFKFACGAGPLCGEPLRHVKVILKESTLSPGVELHNSVEVMHGVGKAVFGSFLSATPMLLEPVYKTVISTPAELAGECSRIISSRRGRITLFENKGVLTVITGFIPVAETFGLSKELRSTTSGRAFWQNIHDHWEQVPEKLAAKVIAELRQRKGLPSELPAANMFLGEE
jgi:elongation factor 2